MNIIICGAGRIGLLIAIDLAYTGFHNITLIEQNETLADRYNKIYDFTCFHGDATDVDVLSKVSGYKADVIIATTSDDTRNIFICSLAQKLFNIPCRIARLRDVKYLKPLMKCFLEENGISTSKIIFPELEIAQQLNNLCSYPLGLSEIVDFAEDKLQLISTKIGDKSVLINTVLSKYLKQFSDHMTIIGVLRDGNMMNYNDSLVLQEEDQIYMLSKKEYVIQLLKDLGHDNESPEDLIVLGDSLVSRLFVKELLKDSHVPNIKIIVEDKAVAKEIAAEFIDVDVFHGNLLHDSYLRENNLAGGSLALALSEDEYVNIISALSAKMSGIKNTIALVDNPFHYSLSQFSSIDVVVNPQTIVVSKILSLLRKNNLNKIYSLPKHQFEIFEYEVNSKSSCLARNVSDIQTDNCQILALHRNDKFYFRPENMVLMIEDLLVINSVPEVAEKWG